MKNKTMTTPLNTVQITLGYVDREPPQKESLPTGPLRQGTEKHQPSLLIFVPRNATSVLINDMTGGYGYSHLAIDCGEEDIPSGKRVMIESTFSLGVHNSFQDEFGKRKFVRIPLEKVGINAAEFCNCVRSKLCEKFDDEEILTFGLLHDPSKQICSDLATVCLPEEMRSSIAHYQRAGFLYYLSTFWPFESPNKIFRLFVTPNGFAEYFGAPRGEQLNGPDQLSEPVLIINRMHPENVHLG
jgi:hypothetical protein